MGIVLVDRYYPFVKSKQGELTAIRKLYEFDTITPVIDVVVPQKESQGDSLKKKLDKIHNLVLRSLSKEMTFYIDHFDLSLDSKLSCGSQPLIHHKKLLEAGFDVGFVTGVDRDDDYNNTIKYFAHEWDAKIGVRLLTEDVEVPRICIKEIDDLLQSIGLESKNVFLIMDLRICNEENYQPKAQTALEFLKMADETYDFQFFVVTSSVFPQQASDLLSTGEEGEFERLEKNIWDLVTDNFHGEMEGCYGDYTVVSPDYMEYDFNGPPPTPPKSVYTTIDKYHVIREYSVNHHQQGFQQYIDLANKVISANYYRGRHYSFGDDYFYNIAGGNSGTGNPTTWITATVNQHLTFIADN